MSFVIAATLNNQTLLIGDKRSMKNGKIDNDCTRKIHKFNNILIGYVGIKERCEFYLSKLTVADLSNGELVYKKICEMIKNDVKYYNDRINVSNYLIIDKTQDTTIHYKIFSFNNQFSKTICNQKATISYLRSENLSNDNVEQMINLELDKKYHSLQDFLSHILLRVSEIDSTVSPDYFLEYLL